MTSKPPLPYSDAPDKDYVGVAFTAMLFGVVLGTGLVALVTFAVRTMQVGTAPSETPDLDSLASSVLIYGTGLSLFGAGAAVYTILRPIRSAYRQGGLAMVTAFATLVVAFVATGAADVLVGRWGLLALALLAGLGAWALSRRLGRQFASL